jgi:creatinine amidohydrolase
VAVASPFWSGYSPHHLSLGGTLTGEFSTILDLLCDVAESGLKNGFDALVLVNGHGGNTPLINAAVSEIGSAHPEVEILGLTYFELIADLVETILKSGVGGMAHGGEFETSVMMYLYPELVDIDKMSATYWDEHYELSGDDLVIGGPVSVYRPFEQYSDSGAIGDPEVANADTGKQLFDGVTKTLGNLLIEVHQKNA